MKTSISIILLFFSIQTLGQDNAQLQTTLDFFRLNNISLNTVQPREGYQVYYNCDSMLFVRGDFSDTIKIGTPASEWAQTLRQFRNTTSKPEYGNTVFAKSILSDGRILVASYHETVFVWRNDSLYQIDDTVSMPAAYFALIVDHVSGKVNNETFTRKKDSIELLYNGRHAYIPKLIFSKNMFNNGKKKVKLSGKVNYEHDEIELGQEWMENGKKCFVVRINNTFGKEKTTYAYALNEDMKFVWWQGCTDRN